MLDAEQDAEMDLAELEGSTSAPLSMLELYAGIGGMRTAAAEIGIHVNVVGFFEINPTALQVYNYNFADQKNKLTDHEEPTDSSRYKNNSVNWKKQDTEKVSHQKNNMDKIKENNITTKFSVKKSRRKKSNLGKPRNLLGLTVAEWETLNPDLVTLSPPCQPFTRQGLQRDTSDARCSSLHHLLDVLRQVRRPPGQLLLENVKGFETSKAREAVMTLLTCRGYKCREVLVSPHQLGLPNTRLRYYLLAVRRPEAHHVDTARPDAPSIEVAVHTDGAPSTEQVFEFPACLCLPGVQTPLRLPHEETRVSPLCALCGKTVLVKVTNLLAKHHARTLAELGDIASGSTDTFTLRSNEIVSELEGFGDENTELLKKFGNTNNEKGGEKVIIVNEIYTERCGTSEWLNQRCVDVSCKKQNCDCCKKLSFADLIPTLKDYLLPVRQKLAAQSLGSDGDELNNKRNGTSLKQDSDYASGSSFLTNRYLLKDKILLKYGKLLDIVDNEARRSCCFTKGYGRLVEGTGSVFNPRGKKELDKVFDSLYEMEALEGAKEHQVVEQKLKTSLNDKEICDKLESRTDEIPHIEDENGVCDFKPVCINNDSSLERKTSLLRSLGLRYLMPEEVLRLMGFPLWFGFPPSGLSDRQQYQMLGNSVNVVVVASLLAVLEDMAKQELQGCGPATN